MKADRDQAIRLELVGRIHGFGSGHGVCADPCRDVDRQGGLADAPHTHRADRPQ
jgi:hypothetical protein